VSALAIREVFARHVGAVAREYAGTASVKLGRDDLDALHLYLLASIACELERITEQRKHGRTDVVNAIENAGNDS
jgi:hypothetical protein